MILSLFLIIIGSAFLLKNLGYISGGTWGIIWPLLLVVFGIGILLRKDRGEFFLAPLDRCCFFKKHQRDENE